MIVQSTDVRSEVRRKRRRDALQCFGGLHISGPSIALGVASGSAPAPLTPITAASGCVTWLEADHTIYHDTSEADPVSDGETIAEWHDRVNNYVFAQLGMAALPEFDADGINSLPAAVNSSSARLQLASTTVIGSAGDFTVVLCGKRNSASNGAMIALGIGGSGFYIGFVSNAARVSDSVSQLVAVSGTLGSTDSFVVTLTRTGTTFAIRCNGPTNSASGTISAGTGDLANPILFNRGLGDLPFVGWLSGGAIYDSVLSGTGLSDAESYWATKYGVTLS